MDSTVYIQLIFLFLINIIFTFSGIVLNTLVIVSIWKSSQLQKKLCHFMVMVLSCFDLVSVVTNHPMILVCIISWLREDYDSLPEKELRIYFNISAVFLVFSLIALLVMSIERYLGAYYPIFHRTSVTRRRILTAFAILLTPAIVMYIISAGSLVIPHPVFLIILLALFVPPFMFVNFKLFTIAREGHRERQVSPETRAKKNFQNISTVLWLVACLMLLSVPSGFYIAFNLAEKDTNTERLPVIWVLTCSTMNCTLNSLIFFWKNKVLRAEGIKILKTFKDRLTGS